MKWLQKMLQKKLNRMSIGYSHIEQTTISDFFHIQIDPSKTKPQKYDGKMKLNCLIVVNIMTCVYISYYKD